MNYSGSDRRCPSCGKGDVEFRGVTAAFYPRLIADDRDRRRGRKVVESKVRCRDCGYEFAEAEEQLF